MHLVLNLARKDRKLHLINRRIVFPDHRAKTKKIVSKREKHVVGRVENPKARRTWHVFPCELVNDRPVFGVK